MHLNKHFLFVIGVPALVVFLTVVGGAYRISQNASDAVVLAPEAADRVVHEEGAPPETNDPHVDIAPVDDEPQPVVTPQVSADGVHFTGELQRVDTGCFADGECFVVVNGKHVTAIRGWSQEIVGTVEGVEGFGDLAQHIGERVEVYASTTADGAYTLYGSTGFFIRLVGTTAQAPEGDTVHVSSATERPEVQ